MISTGHFANLGKERTSFGNIVRLIVCSDWLK
jgi:hypothetical protein